MCHTLLHDPKLYTLLLQADEERAAKVRAAGCSCGGVLHSAPYPRKPRGLPVQLRQLDHKRRSFCCNRSGCRSRYTPQSVFYLGAARVPGYGGAARQRHALCRVRASPARVVRHPWCSSRHLGSLACVVESRLVGNAVLEGGVCALHAAGLRETCPAHCWRASRPRTHWPSYCRPCVSWHR